MGKRRRLIEGKAQQKHKNCDKKKKKTNTIMRSNNMSLIEHLKGHLFAYERLNLILKQIEVLQQRGVLFKLNRVFQNKFSGETREDICFFMLNKI